MLDHDLLGFMSVRLGSGLVLGKVAALFVRPVSKPTKQERCSLGILSK